MKELPRYTKVLTLGSSRTENALRGKVVIQEKVDGSQFRFGINEDGELLIGSKSVSWNGDCDKMFSAGVAHVKSVSHLITKRDVYFFAEYLQKPKHNVLAYDHTPKGNLALFDVMEGGRWHERGEIEESATLLGIDVVPELFRGKVDSIEFLKQLHETTSFLGGQKIEGVVIKNYTENIELGGLIFPLFTKYVREEYKEKHGQEWKSGRDVMADFVNSFATEVRWQKAVSHLRESGAIEQSPRDIGKLIIAVRNDIAEEEGENISKFLCNKFLPEILRTATKGLPEWYKEHLLKNIDAKEGGE